MAAIDALDELKCLLETAPPPFIFINDPVGPRATAKAVTDVLAALEDSLHFVHVNAIACFTTKLLFDAVLNGLANWTPEWSEGCANWPGTADFASYSESPDTFMHGLKAVHASLARENSSSRMVIFVENAERLKERLPDVIVPLTRLAETVRLDISVVFLSAAGWEDIRPPLGAAQDPYYIDIPIPEKDYMIRHMVSLFKVNQSSEGAEPNAYHPTLVSVYHKFASVIYDVCSTATIDPDEIVYIATARWPGFIQPVLDNHHQQLENDTMDVDDLPFAPAEDVTMRLLRFFGPSMTLALEQLYPRSLDAQAWADTNRPTEEALRHAFPNYNSTPLGRQRNFTTEHSTDEHYKGLTSMAKFILIAAYLASMNPAKSDLRMFGRGLDEKKRKRRRIARTTKARPKSGAVKIPQKFLGPATFPLDRMLAILGALLEENDNDDDSRPSRINFSIPGEYTDTEITRVGVYTTITDLTTAQLLYRTTAQDKLDGPPSFKCGVSYDVVLSMAKELDVPLNDLLWDLA